MIKKSIWYRQVFIVLLIVTLLANVSGCKEKTKEYTGYGNNISNLRNGMLVACENEETILFGYGNLLYNIQKEDKSVQLLCQNPACRHQLSDYECLSGKFITNLQYYNGTYYYADLTFSGYFEMEENNIKEIEHIGESNQKGYAFIYNNKLYHLETNKDDELKYDILMKEISGGDEEVIPVREHITDYYPVDEEIFILTMENRLYSIKSDGSNKKILTEDKVIQLIPDGEYLYYICSDSAKKGLYRIKKDGTEKEEIFKDAESFALGKDYIYINIESFSDTGIYIVNRNNGSSSKLSDRKMAVAVFDKWDRIIGYYQDMDIMQNRELMIMNNDGSGMETIELPEVIE